MSYAILTDVTKCIGCQKCVSACKTANGTGEDVPRTWQKRDGLSAHNLTSILSRPEGRYVRKQCRHCIEPACASVCPVGALHKTESGAVVYDRNKCLGCRYCLMACPYGIPRYDWDKPVPYVRKCTLCYERLQQGQVPACVEACPTQATISGNRNELLTEAHRRITDSSGGYIDKVWGEFEVGGTSVMYISDIDLGFMTYKPDLGTRPLPETTSIAMKSVPPVFLGMGAAMFSLNWIVRRRMKLQKDSNGEEE